MGRDKGILPCPFHSRLGKIIHFLDIITIGTKPKIQTSAGGQTFPSLYEKPI